MPAPGLPGHVCALSNGPTAGFAFSAAATCAAVLDSAPVDVVASETMTSLPPRGLPDVTVTLSGALATPGSRNCTRTVSPAWDVSTTRVLGSLPSDVSAVIDRWSPTAL